MRQYILIAKQYNVPQLIPHKTTSSILYENYNDAMEMAKIDFKDRCKFATILKAEKPEIGYSIIPLDELGNITFEGDNVKIGVKK
jgi:hypothetical protein